jgi:hypothetical protein
MMLILRAFTESLRMKNVRLQLLLKKDSRHPAGVEEAHAAAAAAGMKLTASGIATISAEATPDVFRRLFPTATYDAADNDVTGQYDLAVPAELEHVVERISVAPSHLRLD